MEKVVKLIKILENDLDACDFKWTLFVAAANNYKFDSLLKPFPSTFADGKTVDVFRLREVIAIIPTFSSLVDKLRLAHEHKSFIDTNLNDEIIDLLFWCLITIREPFLKSIERSNVSYFQRKNPFFLNHFLCVVRRQMKLCVPFSRFIVIVHLSVA